MPIHDIQKASPRLSRLGIVRLGIKKQSSSGKDYPADVDHFVLADAPDLQGVYGEKPTALLIYLPFATIDENMPAYHELWKASGCMCRGDGQRIIDLMGLDGHKTIRDGQVVRAFAEGGTSYQVGDMARCPGLEHDLYPRCAECHPSAILIAMLRDPNRPVQLVGDRLGYYQIRTHSFYNIQNITGQLTFAAQTAERMGRDLRGIPMILRRVKTELGYTDEKSGERKTATKYLLDLEFDPAWVQWANAGMRSLATSEVLSLPETIDYESGEIVEGGNGHSAPLEEVQEDSNPAPVESDEAQAPPRKVAPVSGKIPELADRPMTPRGLQEWFVLTVMAQSEERRNTLADHKVAASLGKKIGMAKIFDGDANRHLFASALTGRPIATFEELSAAEALALGIWANAANYATREAADVLASLGADGKLAEAA